MKNNKSWFTCLFLINILFLSSCGRQEDKISNNVEEKTEFEGRITPEEFERLNILAENGDADAQYYMGLYHLTGLPATQEYMELQIPFFVKILQMATFGDSIEEIASTFGGIDEWNNSASNSAAWLRRAAEQNHVKSKYFLGILYHIGIGVEYDPKKALQLLEPAAEDNNYDAQLRLALIQIHGEAGEVDLETGIFWLKKAAEQDFPLAQKILGILYAEGYSIEQDYQEAHKWFMKVMTNNNLDDSLFTSEIAHFLGLMYKEGLGVNQNFFQAAKYFDLSANAGIAEAQFELGCLYLVGDGVPFNRNEASRWLKKASEQGHYDAIITLENNSLVTLMEFIELYRSLNLTDELISENEFNMISENAENGDPLSQYYLGLFYINNEIAFTFPVARLASTIFRIQAQLNHAFGQKYEGNFKIEESLFWLNKAFENGSLDAAHYLGCIYYYGMGEGKDSEKALLYFIPAAESGRFPKLYQTIASIYRQRSDNYEDQADANVWYTKAANIAECYLSRLLLAERHANGIGTPVNLKESAKWFALNVEDDCLISMYELGRMYFFGNGVPQDGNKAFNLFQESSSQDFTPALAMLGLCHFTGSGVELNKQNGIEIIQQAALQKDKSAFNMLATIYTDGSFEGSTNIEAYAWMNVGASLGFANLQVTRDELANSMSSQEIQQAQDRSLAISRMIRESQ